jgi:hypothetical protein
MKFLGRWFVILLVAFLAWPIGFMFEAMHGAFVLAFAVFLAGVWQSWKVAGAFAVFALIIFSDVSSHF